MKSSVDSLPETKTQDHDFQVIEIWIRKSKLAVTAHQLSIFNEAKIIFEDTYIFENLFSTTLENVIVSFDD